MKNFGVLLFGLVVLLPAYAQDPGAIYADPASSSNAAPAPDAAAPTDQTPPADAPAADASAETPPADTTSSDTSPADSAASESAPSDAGSAESAPAEPQPADAAATEATPAESQPAADSGDASAPAEADGAAPAAEASTEATASDASAEQPAESQSERKPFKFYVGYDYTHMNMLISSNNPPATSSLQTRFGGDFFTTNFHQARAGIRLFDVIGLEAHYGFKSDEGNAAGKIGMKNYGGIYVAPTGTMLETIEVSALIGYSYMTVTRPGQEETLRGISYGVNAELPIRNLWEALPDLRLGGGGMVYHRDRESRTYGAHFGLRYDFKI